METPTSDLIIKKEETDEDMNSPTVIAAQIYCIEEKLEPKEEAYSINPNVSEPKEEIHEDVNDQECGENGDDLNEGEFQELNSGDLAFNDSKIGEVTPSGLPHNRAGSRMFGVRNESENMKEVDPRANRIFLCPFCGLEFLDVYHWRGHLNDIHEFNKRESLNMENVSGTKFKCKECQHELRRNILDLQNHKIKHLPFKNYVICKLCGKRFAGNASHKHHFARSHNVSED